LTEVTIPGGCALEHRDLEISTDWLNNQESSSYLAPALPLLARRVISIFMIYLF